jgi:hypothetical protein
MDKFGTPVMTALGTPKKNGERDVTRFYLRPNPITPDRDELVMTNHVLLGHKGARPGPCGIDYSVYGNSEAIAHVLSLHGFTGKFRS